MAVSPVFFDLEYRAEPWFSLVRSDVTLFFDVDYSVKPSFVIVTDGEVMAHRGFTFRASASSDVAQYRVKLTRTADNAVVGPHDFPDDATIADSDPARRRIDLVADPRFANLEGVYDADTWAVDASGLESATAMRVQLTMESIPEPPTDPQPF